VLALPDKLDTEGKNEKQHRAFLANLAAKLNAAQNRITLDRLLLYPTQANEDFEDKGIARIQDYMVEREKDERWANHLYPVYLTETYIKSRYRGALHFINRVVQKLQFLNNNRLKSVLRKIIMSGKVIGRAAALEKCPTTIDNFCFWTDKDTLLNPFYIIVADHLNDSKTYGDTCFFMYTSNHPKIPLSLQWAIPYCKIAAEAVRLGRALL
jgi:hypothetical protein